MDPFSRVLPFVQVAEAGGFRTAAARLGVSAAAVSKSVAKLEAELGVALFERSSRHVALTPEGDVFLAHCREAIAQLQAGRDQVAGSQRAPQGTLRVSLPPALGPSLLPVVAQLASRYPRLSLRLVITNRIVRLAEEEIDVALRMGPLADSSLVSRRLRTPRWVTVAAPAYLAAWGTPAAPAELARHTCIKFALQGKIVEWRFRDQQRVAEVATPSRIVFDQSGLVVEAAAQGIGIAQVFDFMATPLVERGQLVELLAPFASEGPPLQALTPARRRRIPRVRAFMQALEELFGGQGEPEAGSSSRRRATSGAGGRRTRKTLP